MRWVNLLSRGNCTLQYRPGKLARRSAQMPCRDHDASLTLLIHVHLTFQEDLQDCIIHKHPNNHLRCKIGSLLLPPDRSKFCADSI